MYLGFFKGPPVNPIMFPLLALTSSSANLLDYRYLVVSGSKLYDFVTLCGCIYYYSFNIFLVGKGC